MGLTKQYLAYRAVENFNIIASGRSNVNFVIYNNIEGRYAAAAAAENVIIWDLRLGERALTLRRGKQEVTALRVSPDHIHIAVGYADGIVEIFDLRTPDASICSLALHKNAVSVLRYDNNGIRLATGGLDNELVVVDVVEQAGQQRLIGHSGSVTDTHFLECFDMHNILISASKDTQIKFWNLETQYCFKTIVDNRTEVWGLALIDNLLIAGCAESAMNVYRLKCRSAEELKTVESAIEGLTIGEGEVLSPIAVTNCGNILRAGKGRTVSLVTDISKRIVSCHGVNGLVESFYFCTEAQAIKRMTKRLKKDKKAVVGSERLLKKEITLSDEIKRLGSIKVKQKIKSIDILLGDAYELRVLLCLANNSLQLYTLDASLKQKQKTNENSKMIRALTRPGHQSELRAVCFSSDGLIIGSGAGDSFKLWNRESMQCLRTVYVDYTLCATFAPGDRYVLLGLKSGNLLIVDVGTGDVIEEIPAHQKELWSIDVYPDRKGCVTCSSDATVKFWTFELIDKVQLNEQIMDETTTTTTYGKTLSLLHKNTLKLEEAILCVRISSDMKYLAVGLLDSSVKIFFFDTLKFFLTLYGHKLPVLCLDITYDARLIATGSADRNVKVWGLDFGDCHRSIFAHDDSVMDLNFIPKTHMFFTCGKDGQIKQWDADTFEKILTLPGHVGESFNLAITLNGKYLVTCGSDRTLRLYERTDELLVLKDVQEEEREEKENQQLATGEDSSIPLLPGLKLASKKTVGAEKAADSIIECLEICAEFEKEDPHYMEKNLSHPLMNAIGVTNIDDFILKTFIRIRPSDLEEALLLIPFKNVTELLMHFPRLLQKRDDELELLCKIVMFLFKVHMKSITNTKSLKPLLEHLVKNLKTEVNYLRDVIGENLHGLALLQRELEERDGIKIFFYANNQSKKNDKKRGAARKRGYIHMT